MTLPDEPKTVAPVTAKDSLAGPQADPGRLGGIPMPESTPESTFAGYATAWAKRIRYGESGILPVVAGLILLVIIFQVQDSVFLSAGNLTNLLVQGAVFILLGMAEVWVLILGEIDLSAGYNAGVGAVITAILASPQHNFPWWLAILIGMLATAAIGALWGVMVIRLRLPSFVVTLAGLLGLEGLLLYLVNAYGSGGTIRITSSVLNDITNGNMSPAAGWIVGVAAVVLFAAVTFVRDEGRRRSGLVAPPLAITLLKVAGVAAAVVVLVMVCNTNRGVLVPLRGVPYVVLVVAGFLVVYSFVLSRTRFGRYQYAIGGNAEAARRGGVSLGWNRLWAFTLTGFTAGAAGIVYASRLGSISNNIDGGQLVLYAVAAAVIGGASLFGGRGKMIHALLGGLVIATIYNGMGLLGLAASYQYMVTALVLLAAVTIDALARRGRTAS
ncbi:MAG: ABC transporter permease [Acidimicrobiales bacterium]|jgi:D-xylose transport system permease protein